MSDFGVNLGRRERKIQKKKIQKHKQKSKRPETYIFRTSSPRPLFWQSLGESDFLVCIPLVDPYSKLLLRAQNGK